MPRRRRSPLLWAAPALAGACLALALTGHGGALLLAAPFLVIAGLLLAGRYPGEARILARRAVRAVAAARRAPGGWRPAVEHARRLLLDRSPASRRGPPTWAPRAA
jgi:hypothetical protein